MKRRGVALLLLLVVLVVVFASCGNDPENGIELLKPEAGILKPDTAQPEINRETTIPPGAVIRIAAFNVKVFGRTKRAKDDVMDILERIAREFDIIFIQEIRDSSEITAQFFLDGGQFTNITFLL